MQALMRRRLMRCAYRTMLLGGLLGSSSGVVMSLLQDRYALGYEWGGVLLAALSVEMCIRDRRGPYRSRGMDALLAEAQALADAGVKELIVIAQDLSLIHI